MRTVTSYNQMDKKWADLPLGKSGLTAGRWGCYSVCVTSGLKSYFFKDETPETFITKMNANGGYDADGQLIWGVIPKLWPGVELVGSAWTKNYPGGNISKLEVLTAIDHIKKNNRRGQVVGICVDNVGNDKYPDHIVLAVETPDDLNEWTIMDPDGGRIMRFKDKYGSPLTGVYGYRIIAGTPANFPPEATTSDVDAGNGIGLSTDDRYTKKDVQKALMGL